ncbi:histidine kinase [Saccharothrix australiensis]|uniref:histidine kinase n=1 Tax=Saccharothrix australiensis TaxID=2072 RepID=A0A495VY57_9PSEU|nr:histidine kinase [Saccharothrix australiensis]
MLATVVAGLSTTTAVTRGVSDPAALVLVGLTAAPLALRQRAPVATMGVALGALGACAVIGEDLAAAGGFGVLVAMFTVATLRPRPVAAAVFAATTLVVWAAHLRLSADGTWSAAALSTVVVLTAWVLGESTRSWGDRVRRLAARSARATLDRRLRLAHELHDLVAHHMSVVTLQAGVAHYVLDSDLDTARRAIATVGDTGREALTELRRLFDVLRVGERGELGPNPGLTDLGCLVDRVRLAGVPVDLEVRGEARPLPAGTDLCAYRVAQESLTNILKHAGRATARVTLDYRGDVLTLGIVNTGGPPPPPRPDHTPDGIRAMRERAELYGGTVTAEPVDGGFAVVLRLPTARSGR